MDKEAIEIEALKEELTFSRMRYLEYFRRSTAFGLAFVASLISTVFRKPSLIHDLRQDEMDSFVLNLMTLVIAIVLVYLILTTINCRTNHEKLVQKLRKHT